MKSFNSLWASFSVRDQASHRYKILNTIIGFYVPRVEAGYSTSTVVPASRKRRRQNGNTVSDETVKYGYCALITWLVSDCTVNPFSCQRRRLTKKNKVIVRRKKKSKIKSGQGSQREAQYQDELVEWLSAARRTKKTERFLCCHVIVIRHGAWIAD
jgi:hypothetical protein